MTKYRLLQLWGLKELLKSNSSSIYSPDGMKLTVVSNGILGGQLLYDYENKKVYGLTLKEIPNLTEDNIEYFDQEWARDNIAYHMSGSEMLKMIEERKK